MPSRRFEKILATYSELQSQLEKLKEFEEHITSSHRCEVADLKLRVSALERELRAAVLTTQELADNVKALRNRLEIVDDDDVLEFNLPAK